MTQSLFHINYTKCNKPELCCWTYNIIRDTILCFQILLSERQLPADLPDVQWRPRQHVHPDEHVADGRHGDGTLPGDLPPVQGAPRHRHGGREGVDRSRLDHVCCLQHPAPVGVPDRDGHVPRRSRDVLPEPLRHDVDATAHHLQLALLHVRDRTAARHANLLQYATGEGATGVVASPSSLPSPGGAHRRQPPHHVHSRHHRRHVHNAGLAGRDPPLHPGPHAHLRPRPARRIRDGRRGDQRSTDDQLLV